LTPDSKCDEWNRAFKFVMPGLVPGIHVFRIGGKKDVDGRVKPGQDERESISVGGLHFQ
jgi:hypothetical protein